MSDAREVPVLFSGPMVRSLLSGNKTETRRIIKGDIPDPPAMDAIHPKHVAKHPAPYFDSYCGERKTASNPRGMSVNWCWWTRDDRQCLPTVKLRWKPGDVLWVRETFARVGDNDDDIHACPDLTKHVYFRTDSVQPEVLKWRPSIHMPRWASRITLEVTALRVERLQEINEAGARAEGITDGGCLRCGNPEPCGCADPTPSARDGFAHLWHTINGPGSWDANPFVSVTTFRRIASTPVIGGLAYG